MPAEPPPLRFQNRIWLHALLFGLTALTTTMTGLDHYAGFLSEFGARTVTAGWNSIGYGFWYSGTILAILTAHEMGHYLACRYYQIDASLPYFIPFYGTFLGFLTGTFGAVIRIREPILWKRQLFDIGVAGPIAGFVVAVPALIAGLMMSAVLPLPPHFQGFELGEPLLFRTIAWLVAGPVPAGQSLNMHPVAFAAWVGLLLTAFNLIPALQLDGGHISYAALGGRAVYLTYVIVVAVVVLAVVSATWRLPALILLLVLYKMGPHHPPVLDPESPLGWRRTCLTIFAIVMFIVCFTPTPLAIFEMPGK